MLDIAQYILNLKNRIIHVHVYWILHPHKAKIKNNNEIQPLHLLKPKYSLFIMWVNFLKKNYH